MTKPIAGLIKRVGPIDSSGQPKWWLFALWYGCLTFIVVHTLHYLLFHNGDTDAGYQLAMQTHQRVVTLNDFASVQYRFFSYFVPELIHRLLGTNIPQSYTAFRWVWLWGSCLALQRYLCSWFDWRTAFIGNLIVIATMPFMYLEVDLLNTDAPAYAFFVLGLMLLRGKEAPGSWLPCRSRCCFAKRASWFCLFG